MIYQSRVVFVLFSSSFSFFSFFLFFFFFGKMRLQGYTFHIIFSPLFQPRITYRVPFI